MDSTVPVMPAEGQEPAFPTLVKRIQSSFIDLLFIVLLMLPASRLLDSLGEGAPEWINIVIFLALWGVYEPLCTAIGCTVGNWVTGIRVRRSADIRKKIPIWAAYARYALKCLLGWLSFITIHFNPERRALHDLGAGSVVVLKHSLP